MKIIIISSLLIMSACVSVIEKPRNSDLAGSYYQVKPGDTLSQIAAINNVAIDEIMYINGIDDQRFLRAGQALFLPDPDPIGKKITKLRPKPEVTKKIIEAEKFFDFPLKGGHIMQNFSYDKKNPYDGIGIKASKGAPVKAAQTGRVLFVGDDGTKFGLLVIIEHKQPFITVYAHLDKALVKTGQKVKIGEQIGTVGMSGGASLPHLHFQVRVDTRPKDPRAFLRSLE